MSGRIVGEKDEKEENVKGEEMEFGKKEGKE
jgi:hypothetical protein